MFEKYLKAAKTLLELAKDRGFPIYSTYVNPTLFKQKYEMFSRGGETNVDVLDYVIRDLHTDKRLLLCFYFQLHFFIISTVLLGFFVFYFEKMNG